MERLESSPDRGRRAQHRRASAGLQANGGRRRAAALAAALLLGAAFPDGAAAQSAAPAASPDITAGEIRHVVAVLAHDSLAGRRAGTSGADRAASWIAGRFAALGLEPPGPGQDGDAGSSPYLQVFAVPEHGSSPHGTVLPDGHPPVPTPPAQDGAAPGPHDAMPHARRDGAEAAHAGTTRTARTANVVGILPGADAVLAREAIVIGAHYDHLGLGGEGSLALGEPAIHNGADDNASGVAGVLEMAGRFAADPPRRTLVFVAFGAEELGNVGSLRYVADPAWPLERTVAMVNLDMIGRLRDRVTVLGTGTSSAWPGLLDDVVADLQGSGAEPLEVARVPDGYGPSDHASFYGRGIPVLAFFTGAHEDYHRPTDDAERVQPAGAQRVVELAAALVEEVARGADVPYAEAPVTQRRPMAFRVGLGTMPDYAFAGPGLRIAGVRPGSAADRAGLVTGDVMRSLAGREIADVYGYTAILSGLEAGREVELVYERGGERRTVGVTPEER